MSQAYFFSPNVMKETDRWTDAGDEATLPFPPINTCTCIRDEVVQPQKQVLDDLLAL